MTVRLRLARVGDLRRFGLQIEQAIADRPVTTLEDLLTVDSRVPQWYADVLEEMGGHTVAVEDLPGWAVSTDAAIAIVNHWQHAPLCPWDAARPEQASKTSALAPSWEQDRERKKREDDGSMVTIEPSNLPGIMGLLSFLYRMMAVNKYRIADVDALEVWQCAVALGVDSKMMPMGDDGQPGRQAERKQVTDDDMMRPTEVIDIDPARLEGRTAFATTD